MLTSPPPLSGHICFYPIFKKFIMTCFLTICLSLPVSLRLRGEHLYTGLEGAGQRAALARRHHLRLPATRARRHRDAHRLQGRRCTHCFERFIKKTVVGGFLFFLVVPTRTFTLLSSFQVRLLVMSLPPPIFVKEDTHVPGF